MTYKHPLTDDIIRYDKKLGCHDLGTWIYTENDLRAAADWQLDQVVEWLRHNLHLMPTGVDYIVGNLREAMRPTTTTQEDNNE